MTTVQSAVQDPAALPLFKSPEGEARFMDAYDAVLRDWPVPYQELDLPTRLGRTHLIVSGAPGAPPLLLLPSMAGTATLWRPNVAALSPHYRTYAVDTIGQVGKSAPARRIRDREECAGWLVDLLNALDIRRTAIVGSSYGGFLAMNQALLTPDRVDRVVLISPAGTFVGGLVWVFLRARLKRLLAGDRRPRGITDLLGEGAQLDPSDAAWGALMSVTLADSARPNLVTPKVFGKNELAANRIPTLLLIGERELLYKPDQTLRLAMRRMPGLSGAIIPNAHHLAALACPHDVSLRILRFLGEGGGRPA